MVRRLGLYLIVAVSLLAAMPRIARASLANETLTSFVKRVGGRVESNEGNLFVTSYAVERGRVEIRLVNDASKQRLGFYAYGFGSAKNAKDQRALFEYMLRANSDLAIGSFFVDADDDIGYKFFLSTREPMNYLTFETVYVAMAKVIATRGGEIVKMTTGGGPSDEAEPKTESDPGTPKVADVGR